MAHLPMHGDQSASAGAFKCMAPASVLVPGEQVRRVAATRKDTVCVSGATGEGQIVVQPPSNLHLGGQHPVHALSPIVVK